MIKYLFNCLILLTLWSCGLTTVRPKLEMAMAQTAFLAAKDAKSSKHSPQLFRKAEFFYLKAKSNYRRKYFNKAKEYAKTSQVYSEKAEYISLKKLALDKL